MRECIFIVFILGCCLKSFGQVQEKEKDTTARDSIALYQKLKQYSNRNKFTKTLHKLVFRQKTQNPGELLEQPYYAPYQDKIIRNIIIHTRDPFGYSSKDSVNTPATWLGKAGNAIHVTSNDASIQKFLLFDEGESLDTLLLQESARLLRRQNYVRKVRIIPAPIENTKDSVDLIVEVLDSWSLIPKASFSESRAKVGLRERNFIGTGHRVDAEYDKRHTDGQTGFEGIYQITNFKNSFIDVTGKYALDVDQYYDQFISVNRDFYSPLARWAGGVFIQKRFLGSLFPNDSATFIRQDFKYFYHDYWGAYAFQLFKKNTKKRRTTKLVLSLRSFFLNYKEAPDIAYDSIRYFSDEHFYLTSIGVTSREFIKDRYIFRDGDIEDVPVGSLFSLTAGVQRKNQKNRFYSGLRASHGNYNSWGFFSGNIELGTFFDGSQTEQTTLSLKANYFSNLLNLGGEWKMRQFIKPQLVMGFNRFNSVADRLGLNENSYFKGVNSYNYIDYNRKNKYVDYKNGNIQGFKSVAYGTRKYVLDLQTQFYSPWTLLGFRFNPFANVSLGMLAGKGINNKDNKIYSSLGAGFIVRNDYLVFDSFQFSFSYYPSMPGEGNGIFQTNSFRSEDFGFQDFKIGEPRPVIFE